MKDRRIAAQTCKRARRGTASKLVEAHDARHVMGLHHDNVDSIASRKPLVTEH
jgi:hypothetical protein